MGGIFSEYYVFAAILNFAVKGCEIWNQEIFLVPGLAPDDRKIEMAAKGNIFSTHG